MPITLLIQNPRCHKNFLAVSMYSIVKVICLLSVLNTEPFSGMNLIGLSESTMFFQNSTLSIALKEKSTGKNNSFSRMGITLYNPSLNHLPDIPSSSSKLNQNPTNPPPSAQPTHYHPTKPQNQKVAAAVSNKSKKVPNSKKHMTTTTLQNYSISHPNSNTNSNTFTSKKSKPINPPFRVNTKINKPNFSKNQNQHHHQHHTAQIQQTPIPQQTPPPQQTPIPQQNQTHTQQPLAHNQKKTLNKLSQVNQYNTQYNTQNNVHYNAQYNTQNNQYAQYGQYGQYGQCGRCGQCGQCGQCNEGNECKLYSESNLNEGKEIMDGKGKDGDSIRENHSFAIGNHHNCSVNSNNVQFCTQNENSNININSVKGNYNNNTPASAPGFVNIFNGKAIIPKSFKTPSSFQIKGCTLLPRSSISSTIVSCGNCGDSLIAPSNANVPASHFKPNSGNQGKGLKDKVRNMTSMNVCGCCEREYYSERSVSQNYHFDFNLGFLQNVHFYQGFKLSQNKKIAILKNFTSSLIYDKLVCEKYQKEVFLQHKKEVTKRRRERIKDQDKFNVSQLVAKQNEILAILKKEPSPNFPSFQISNLVLNNLKKFAGKKKYVYSKAAHEEMYDEEYFDLFSSDDELPNIPEFHLKRLEEEEDEYRQSIPNFSPFEKNQTDRGVVLHAVQRSSPNKKRSNSDYINNCVVMMGQCFTMAPYETIKVEGPENNYIKLCNWFAKKVVTTRKKLDSDLQYKIQNFSQVNTAATTAYNANHTNSFSKYPGKSTSKAGQDETASYSLNNTIEFNQPIPILQNHNLDQS